VFVLHGFTNPPSTQPFTGGSFNLYDVDNYLISKLETSSMANHKPALIDVAYLQQSNLVPDALAEYTLVFHNYNVLPQTGSIIISHPDSVELSEGITRC
jgi:hypothetical protein